VSSHNGKPPTPHNDWEQQARDYKELFARACRDKLALEEANRIHMEQIRTLTCALDAWEQRWTECRSIFPTCIDEALAHFRALVNRVDGLLQDNSVSVKIAEQPEALRLESCLRDLRDLREVFLHRKSKTDDGRREG
jgi:hypothetical protein